MRNKIPIILGCDCDPDRISFNMRSKGDRLSWDGIKLGIIEFNNARKIIFDQTGVWFKMTWFVRADLETLQKCGSYSYCFLQFKKIWEFQIELGDEIAWHPHFWNVQNNAWFQETTDYNFQCNMLESAFQEISKIDYLNIEGTHSGWCYQNGSTLKTLNDLGLKYDCSALPGNNTLGIGKLDQSDWTNAPQKPYNPSNENHNIAAGKVLNKNRLVEIPATVVFSRKAQFVRSVNEAIKRKKFNPDIIKRFHMSYPQLCLNSLLTGDLFMRSILDLTLDKNSYLFFYGHADEFLDNKMKNIGKKIAYGKNYMVNNLLSVHQYAQNLDLDLQPATMAEQWSKLQ